MSEEKEGSGEGFLSWRKAPSSRSEGLEHHALNLEREGRRYSGRFSYKS